MSDTVRNYSWGGNSSKRRRALRRHGPNIAKYVLPVLVVTIVWGFWITRDNYPMAAFVARDHSYEIFINNVVDRRKDFINSNLPRLFPEPSRVRQIADGLSRELPLPEWLLNNVNDGLCHISGNDISRPENTLVVTKMTRIGCISEKIARLLPAVEHDEAGGLDLYLLPDAGFYYAVRGRTFLLTASRDCLIRALSLDKERAVPIEEFEERIQRAGGADLYCRMEPAAFPVEYRPFEELSFALKFENESARFLVQGRFSEEFQTHYEALFPAAASGPLPAPFDAVASVSMDFGKPLSEILDALAKVFYESDIFPEWLWHSYKMPENETEITSLQPLIASMIQTSDSRVRLGWFGTDPYEIVPVPLIAATFETDTDGVLLLFESITQTPEVSQEIDLIPRLNAEEMLVHVPFIGGPNLEPTLVTFNEGIIFSSSLPLAMDLKTSLPLAQGFNQEGNLYACVKPTEAMEALLQAARELALSGLLRGYTPESLELAAKPWMDAASSAKEAALLASWSGGQLRAEVKISMQPPRPVNAAEGEDNNAADTDL